ncbi:MAG: antitoxin family protein [Archaeoglobi archaeon]|nr:antitoxin family protein [Archaeoglobi archaeon]
MPRVIEAVYENGVFKPLEKVNLKEGEKVRIQIESAESILQEVFGILRGKDAIKALRELEDEWGVH